MNYIIMYLVAIVLANLTVAWFGPKVTIINAFLFIGLDLTARDKLHDVWHNSGLIWKMGLLIGSGSLLSWLLNRNSGRIALASFVAFALSGIADFFIYHLLFQKSKIIKVNGSNVVSAAVDSVAFPTLAFGTFMPIIVIGQFLAKITGGFIWSIVLTKSKFTDYYGRRNG